MILSDSEKQKKREEIFELVAEAHVQLFQYNDSIIPGWARIAGLLKQAGGQLSPARIGEIIDSPRIARERNEAASKEKVAPKKNTPKAETTAPVKKTRVPRKPRTKAAPKKDA
jgi:hypothetical protein